MCGLYRRFDRDRFTVYAFDYSNDDGSAMRRQIMGDVDAFIRVADLTPRQAAQRIADDMMFLNDSEIVEVGPTAEMFAEPKREITAKYLSGEMG